MEACYSELIYKLANIDKIPANSALLPGTEKRCKNVIFGYKAQIQFN
jgi:hypothetical protein